jgi:hypothetical protein
LAADLTSANIADTEAPSADLGTAPEMPFLLVDLHYNAPNNHEECQQVVST